MSTGLFDNHATQEAKMAGTELLTKESGGVMPAQQLMPAQIIQQMIMDGRDPGPMMEVFDQWEARIAAEAYGHALACFQSECPPIEKTRQIDLGGGKGPKYADYSDIDDVVRPVMAKFGLSKTYSASVTDAGQMKVVCRIRHGRHVEENEVTLPVPAQMRVNDTQKMAAALSYGKRLALCAALDIVVCDEDKDGNGLVETIAEEQIATLREWIVSTNANEPGFLKFMGVKSLAEIAVGDFAKALDALKRKAKR